MYVPAGHWLIPGDHGLLLEVRTHLPRVLGPPPRLGLRSYADNFCTPVEVPLPQSPLSAPPPVLDPVPGVRPSRLARSTCRALPLARRVPACLLRRNIRKEGKKKLASADHMAARSLAATTTAQEYHRSREMQLHHAPTGRPDQHGYSLGHSHQTGPYPMHSFSGPPSSSVAGGIDVRSARDSGSTGGFLHPGTSGDGGEAVRALGNNMGVMSAASPPSAPPTSRRDGYPDVAVARQCEREGCNVQPSYGKVWKKVSRCEINRGTHTTQIARGTRSLFAAVSPGALAGDLCSSTISKPTRLKGTGERLGIFDVAGTPSVPPTPVCCEFVKEREMSRAAVQPNASAPSNAPTPKTPFLLIVLAYFAHPFFPSFCQSLLRVCVCRAGAFAYRSYKHEACWHTAVAAGSVSPVFTLAWSSTAQSSLPLPFPSFRLSL